MSDSTGTRTPRTESQIRKDADVSGTGQHVNRGNAVDNGQRTVGTAGNTVGPRERGGDIAGRDTAPDFGKAQRS